jgi:hypothetical protein
MHHTIMPAYHRKYGMQGFSLSHILVRLMHDKTPTISKGHACHVNTGSPAHSDTHSDMHTHYTSA